MEIGCQDIQTRTGYAVGQCGLLANGPVRGAAASTTMLVTKSGVVIGRPGTAISTIPNRRPVSGATVLLLFV
jgi:hypothetical protein